jgi:hypothetical protein
MEELQACLRCGGFLGASVSVCPHCQAKPPRGRRRRLGIVLGLAGSASLGLTMMACYGAPPCEPGTNGCRTPTDVNNDAAVDGGAPD